VKVYFLQEAAQCTCPIYFRLASFILRRGMWLSRCSAVPRKIVPPRMWWGLLLSLGHNYSDHFVSSKLQRCLSELACCQFVNFSGAFHLISIPRVVWFPIGGIQRYYRYLWMASPSKLERRMAWPARCKID